MDALLLDTLTRRISVREFSSVYTEALYSNISQQKDPQFPSLCHVGSVNSLSMEQLDYRFLLSGGADGSIKLWDTSSISPAENQWETRKYSAIGSISKKDGHEFGVSSIQWWPQDTGLFVSSSFDHTVRVWDTNALSEVHSFNMEQRVYNIDMSPTGIETLVAVASDDPFLRLLDLRSTSSAQTLFGHKGTILSVKWSPTNPYILASGGTDGELKIWDIRRSNSCVCRLDMFRTNTSYPIASTSNRIKAGAEGKSIKAHQGPVNGLVWTDDGAGIISCGNDNKIRVWDLEPEGGINKLVNFGPLIRNKYPQTLSFCLSPINETEVQYLFFPSDNGYMSIFSAHDGKLVSRLHSGALSARICCIAYAGMNSARYYCGNGNGEITVWGPPVASSSSPEEHGSKKDDSDHKKDILEQISNEIEARSILNSENAVRRSP